MMRPMNCEQATEMMMARLDGHLAGDLVPTLEAHLDTCPSCRAEWRSLKRLDDLFSTAPMVRPPVRLRVQVMTRLQRREQARRAIVGSTALVLGTIALTLLLVAPVLLDLLRISGIAPTLLSGGPATVVQLLSTVATMGRTLLVLLETFAAPLAALIMCSLALAFALNRLWVGALGRLRINT